MVTPIYCFLAVCTTFTKCTTGKTKYVFVSFGQALIENILPTGLSGREVLNLKKDQDENKFNALFAKLREEELINFSDVNAEQVEIAKIQPKPFTL